MDDKEWKFITDPRDLVGLVGKKIQVARQPTNVDHEATSDTLLTVEVGKSGTTLEFSKS